METHHRDPTWITAQLNACFMGHILVHPYIHQNKALWVFDEAFFEEIAGKLDTSGVSSWRPVPGLLSWCSDFGSGHCGSSGVRLSEVSSSGARSSVGSCGLGASVLAPWRQARGGGSGIGCRHGPFPFHNISHNTGKTGPHSQMRHQ